MASKGILGRKLGMTQVWDSDNRVIPVTVIQAGPCRVVQLKTPERDGYSAVQIAFGAAKEQRLTKPELGHLKKNGAAPSKHLADRPQRMVREGPTHDANSHRYARQRV